MTDRPAKTDASSPAHVFCRRLERTLPIVDHLECPYCFGKGHEVRTTDHERFCDFELGKDPIHFGFPEGFGG